MKLLIGFLLMLLCAARADATTFYVNKAGNNSPNTCTTAQSPTDVNAKLTIAAGLACLSAGDTLIVGDGTYAERFTDQIPSGTSSVARTIVRAENRRLAIIRPSGTVSPNTILLFNNPRTHIQVSGFVISGASASPANVNGIGISGGALSTHSDIYIYDNEIGPVGGNGLSITGTDSLIVDSNYVHDTGTADVVGQSHGMYISNNSGNATVSNNQIDDSVSYGIQLYLDAGTLLNISVFNNRFARCGTGGESNSSEERSCIINYSSNSFFYNNIVVDATYSGFDQHSGSNNQYLNNTFYSNRRSALRISGGASTTMRNNLMLADGAGIIGSPTVQSNNITAASAATHVTNAAAGDFTLIAGSSAVDGGTSLSSVFTTDIIGTTRPVGGAWDVGAYEKTNASGPSLTLLNPNGGTLGAVSSSQTFTWGFTDAVSVPNVKLSYDAANDGVFETVISASTPNDGSFAFTASATPTTTGRFKVEDAADGSPSDVSDSNVTITASAGGSLTKIISDNTTGSFIGDIPGTTDAMVKSEATTTNYGTGLYFEATKYAVGDHAHSLLKFDGLSQIPAGATITSVTLGIYLKTAQTATAQTIDVRRVLRDWSESQATWNIYSTGNNWNTPGGLGAATDRVSTAIAQFTGVTSTLGYYAITDTSGSLFTTVSGWINGSLPNYGIHLERNGTGEDTAFRLFGSSEGIDGQRPYLSVTYSTTVPTITVTQPTGLSHFFPGQSMPIRWTSVGLTGNFSVEISYNGGTSYQPTPIIASHPYDQADAVWTVTGPASVGQARVRVCQGATCGESQNFTISGTTLSIR